MKSPLAICALLTFLASGLPGSCRAQTGITLTGIPPGAPAAVKREIEKLGSPVIKERADAVMKLRYLGMRGEADAAVPFLVRMLGSADEFPAITLMISSLSSITRSYSPGYTFGGEAAEDLARIGRKSDELLDSLKSSDWRVRANAARALGGLKDARAVEPLIALVGDDMERPEVRGNAALALGLMEATAPVVDALIAGVKDTDPGMRAAVIWSLGNLRETRALPSFIAALEDEDARVRMRAASALGGIGGPAALDPLIRALKDSDRQVREVTASALGRVKDARAVEPLVAALKDNYANVRINAAGALGEIRDAKAVEHLIPLLEDGNGSVRGAAAEALGGIKAPPRSLQPLVAMALKEKQEIPLARALAALAEMGHSGGERAFAEYRRHRADWSAWWEQNKAEILGAR